MSFTGSIDSGKAIFAFNPTQVGYFDQSPYIQNCTNFIPNSIGLKVDGAKAIGPTKSMVLDSYTQYNQGGIGASISNEGYAQLVSLFTICDETAVICESGASCDLTNSNSSFGTNGLIADGVGPKKYTGIVTAAAAANSSEFALNVSVPTLNVTAATYDNTTGLTTITVDATHNLNVGMGVTIAGLGFTCPSGPGIATFPSGISLRLLVFQQQLPSRHMSVFLHWHIPIILVEPFPSMFQDLLMVRLFILTNFIIQLIVLRLVLAELDTLERQP
jgi:hypothetical protein